MLNYPVKYVDFPEDKVLVNKLPNEFSLRVKAFGFDLLRYKFINSYKSITFGVKDFTDGKLEKKNLSHFALATNHIKDRISKQFASEVYLEEIYPDTIRFHFSKIIQKKVAIKPRFNLSYQKQYMKGGEINISPDSVVISGASIVLDTVNEVYTRNLTFTNLAKSVKRNITLAESDYYDYTKKRVVVNIPVDQFTEAERFVKINVKNLPDSILLRLFPSKLKVFYNVGLHDYESIRDEQFSIVVDYLEISSLNGNKLVPLMEASPINIFNLRFGPKAVSFIKEKKTIIE